MSDHHFDSHTEDCLGCGISRAEVRDGFGVKPKRGTPHDPRVDACPSQCRLINDEHAGILAVITAPDRLVITGANGVILRLGANGARALLLAAAGSHR